MLKLPYGVSNFTKLVEEEYYFVDRTPYIAQLEQMNNAVEPALVARDVVGGVVDQRRKVVC